MVNELTVISKPLNRLRVKNYTSMITQDVNARHAGVNFGWFIRLRQVG